MTNNKEDILKETPMQEIVEIVKEVGADGWWGLSVVGPKNIDLTTPQEGSLAHLGRRDGLEVYRFTPGQTGQWVLCNGDTKPVVGATTVFKTHLLSWQAVSLIIGGEFFAVTKYKDRRRESTLHAYKHGVKIGLPAPVLMAMGLVPAEETPVEVETPAPDGALSDALKKAGL